MANEQDYVDLGILCVDICKTLKRTNGRAQDNLNKSVFDAMNQLTTCVELAMHVCCPIAYHSPDRRTIAEIQGEVLKRSGRRRISRFLRSKDDKDAVAGWKSDLNRLLRLLNVCLVCLCLVVTDWSSVVSRLKTGWRFRRPRDLTPDIRI